MAVTNNPVRTRYTATGGQTTFSIPFAWRTTADIKVYRNQVLQTISTNYTVSGGTPQTYTGSTEYFSTLGGNVVFNSGVNASDEIIILRDSVFARTTSFAVNGAFRAVEANSEFDNLHLMIQELKGTPKLLTSFAELTDIRLPTPALRAGKVLGFTADGLNFTTANSLGTFRGDWTTATAYVFGDTMRDPTSKNVYYALSDHTSGTLATDIGAGKWSLAINVSDVQTQATNAATSATNAANSATTASTQATNAATSATNAANSATSASGSATTATTQAGNASTYASNASTSATNAANSATAAANSATAAAASAAVTTAHGQCRLVYTNGTTVTLVPYNGNKMYIPSLAQTITLPSGGVTLSNTGMAVPLTPTTAGFVAATRTATVNFASAHNIPTGALVSIATDRGPYTNFYGYAGVPTISSSTQITYVEPAISGHTFTDSAAGSVTASGWSLRIVYYVYLYSNAGTPTLELSTTGHTTDASGVEVKSGDNSRVLVGMVAPVNNAGAANFADTVSLRLVASWYNRRPRRMNAKVGGEISITSGPFEVSTSNRCTFLLWADAPGVQHGRAGYLYSNTSGTGNLVLNGFNGIGNVSGSYPNTNHYALAELAGGAPTYVTAPAVSYLSNVGDSAGFDMTTALCNTVEGCHVVSTYCGMAGGGGSTLSIRATTNATVFI